MASERLTISEKDRIARNIIKPIIEQARKECEKFKDNFPEAYNIFMGFPKENVKGNKCDDIEKLRAELSKL